MERTQILQLARKGLEVEQLRIVEDMRQIDQELLAMGASVPEPPSVRIVHKRQWSSQSRANLSAGMRESWARRKKIKESWDNRAQARQ